MMMLGESHDLAKPDKEGLSLTQLDRFLGDMKNAPAWRTRASMEEDYYDGNQHSPDAVADLQEKGLPVITVNLIAPTINLVLGMEERARTDWVVKADGCKPNAGGLTDLQAMALSQELNDVERNTSADRACSEAYAQQVKAGLGWVETGRQTNPFRYPYRCASVDYREIWWDMRAKDLMLEDCRWLCRKKWNDVDVLKTQLPQNRHAFLDMAMNQRAIWDQTQLVQQFTFLQDSLIGRDWQMEDAEWRDTDRQRVCAYEVWYRTWQSGWVLKFQDGRVKEFDQKNPIQVAAVAMGMAEPIWAAYDKMRLSWWVGPFRMIDIPSPYSHNDFPYIPFFGYIEGNTRTPYGMVRSMRSLQDEVNARRARMMWQLSATRTIVEEDAVDDHRALANEVGRPDAYIKLNKNRRSRQGVKAIEIVDAQGLNAQQFEVYQDAAKRLQDASGVYSALLGKTDADADAGVAIDLLIQQGTTTLSELNANARTARTKVGRHLLHLRMEDMEGNETKVKLEDKRDPKRRTVVFNRKKQAPMEQGGGTYLENDTTRMLWHVALEDAPQSTAAKQQRMKDLVEYAKTLDPPLRDIFADIVVMASDLPDKEQIAARIRQVTGVKQQLDPETATPEEIQEQQQQDAEQQQQAAMQQKAFEAEVDEKIAGAENTRANTGLTRVQTVEKVIQLNLVPQLPGGAGNEPSGPSEGEEGSGSPTSQPTGPVASPQEIASATGDAVMLESEMHGGAGASAQPQDPPMSADSNVSFGAGM